MMSEDENKTADSAPEKDFLLDLSFGPAWARRPSGHQYIAQQPATRGPVALFRSSCGGRLAAGGFVS